jgi:hypothetical protein
VYQRPFHISGVTEERHKQNARVDDFRASIYMLKGGGT